MICMRSIKVITSFTLVLSIIFSTVSTVHASHVTEYYLEDILNEDSIMAQTGENFIIEQSLEDIITYDDLESLRESSSVSSGIQQDSLEYSISDDNMASVTFRLFCSKWQQTLITSAI